MKGPLENQTRPRICLLAPEIWPILSGDRQIEFAGGAEVHILHLARGLRDAGYSVAIVAKLPASSTGVTEVDGFRIVQLHRGGVERPILRNVHPRLTTVWRALRDADADVYFQSNAGANTLVCGLFCRLHEKRFAYLAASDVDFDPARHKELFPGRGGWRDQQAYRLGLRLCDAIVAQHAGQITACNRWLRNLSIEIPNLYEVKADSSPASDGVVLWVATVKSLKRPELFLALAESLPQYRFRLVGGPGPGKERLVYEQIKQRAAKISNVEFAGFVPYVDVERHFEAARVLVNTSDYEGFPSTFLQSWARAIPTISFFNCGARLEGRSVGIVAKDLDDMRSALTNLMDSDRQWAEEGRRCQEYCATNHSAIAIISKFDRLIASLHKHPEHRV